MRAAVAARLSPLREGIICARRWVESRFILNDMLEAAVSHISNMLYFTETSRLKKRKYVIY